MLKPIAFFDVDGTVIKNSSGVYAGWQLFKKGYFKWNHLANAGLQFFLHSLNGADHDAIYRSTIDVISGLSLEELGDICYQTFMENVRQDILLGATQLIEMHKSREEKVVFISAGPHGIIELLGQYLQADDVIISKLVYNQQGILDPLLNKDVVICYGKNKVQLAKEYMANRPVSLKDCYFYSDSSSDLPLMEEVGHPVAINPDFELSVKAFFNRWPVYRFRDTVGKMNLDQYLGRLDMEKIMNTYWEDAKNSCR